MCSGRAKLHLRTADQKQSFLSGEFGRAPLLHVSTHALADFEAPERSRLLFAPAAAGGPNQYVFLKELYDADFHGVDLATLSACETDKGRLVRGEGIQAFSRALLSRGARSALTTLWRVPDGPTAEFMKQFYFFLLVKGEPKAEALRQAKLKFLRSKTELAEPRYWAAFVLNGEGATTAPAYISWSRLSFGVLLLTITAVAGASWMRHR